MDLDKVIFTEEFEDAVPVCSHAGQMAEGGCIRGQFGPSRRRLSMVKSQRDVFTKAEASQADQMRVAGLQRE